DSRAAQFGWRFFAPNWDFQANRAEVLTSGPSLEMGDLYIGFEALHGIQNRLPLLDLRLVEWCFAIPEEQYLRQGQTRWMIRRLMTGRLANSVLHNRRRGSKGADWHRRMTRDLPRIREQLDVLASDSDVCEIIDIPRVKKLLDEWPADAPDKADQLSGQ